MPPIVRSPRSSIVAAVAGLLLLGGCASHGGPPPKLDFTPAQAAIDAARQAGADTRAPEPLGRAEAHLKEAADLASASGTRDADTAHAAQALVRLAATEAEWAASVATAPPPPVVATPHVEEPAAARAEIEARVRRAEEEQRRLEERVGFLLKELELTETELVRSKAKVKGQTKAEASSAVAEAQILLRRMADEKMRSPNLVRCQELLDRAEQLLRDENYGGAAFFAMTAQDLVEQTRRLATDPTALDRPAPKRTYVVASDTVNLRKAPGTTEPVVGHAPRGASVEATVVRGEWVRVTYGDTSGWIYRPLLQ
jgi:SH3 domain-containing protein